jgi:ADP-ribose pyrophosphatase YjhB (NUDIX family)
MTTGFTYCPRCGAPLAEGTAFGRRRRLCRYCGFIHFREPKVAVAALVSDGGRVLLVRRAVIPRLGYWALPAGYMDADELPAESVAREVAEETGLTVRVLGLLDVAPLADKEGAHGILMVYRAEPIRGKLAAQDDVSEARWFAPAEIPWNELAFESTGRFLREWAEAL